jgi:ABC-2 type transport system ATP-binding protein
MRYGEREVVKGIDLTVRSGEVFAFLGPNGAGKTTTVEILEGFRTPTTGHLRVLGADPRTAGARWRERIGVVLQSSTPEPCLTVRETVELYAGFYGHSRPIDDVLTLTGLEMQAAIRNERLSNGQQRRLDFALALVGDPDLIFLDEPTTGFDPAARRAAWEVIAGLRDLGKTVFLTTHYLEEAEALADHIAVITDGRIVAEGSPADLGGRHELPSTIAFFPATQSSISDLPSELAELARAVDDGSIRIETRDAVRDLLQLTSWAVQGRHRLEHLEVRRPSLEETYLTLTHGGAERWV